MTCWRKKKEDLDKMIENIPDAWVQTIIIIIIIILFFPPKKNVDFQLKKKLKTGKRQIISQRLA